MTGNERLLHAILGEPDICEHIEALAEFMAKQPVVITGGHGTRDTEIECRTCDATIAFHTFAGLVMSAMQEKN